MGKSRENEAKRGRRWVGFRVEKRLLSTEAESSLGSGEIAGESVVSSVDLGSHDSGLLSRLVLFGEVLFARGRKEKGGRGQRSVRTRESGRRCVGREEGRERELNERYP